MFSALDFEKLKGLFIYDPWDPLLFSTSFFLIAFFILLFFYRLFAESKGMRIFLLLVFSLFFYYKAAGEFALLLVFSAFFNYYAGKWIGISKSVGVRRGLFYLAILVNLGLLVYFKYTNFFIEILNDVSSGNIELLDIFMPVGISFYTFKALSYIIDIYLDEMEPINSLRDFSLFIFFFPTLLAGPIERASKFLPQVKEDISITKSDIGTAAFLIMSGLIKKSVIADYIGINFVDRVFGNPLMFTGVENLLAAYTYALQLFLDFSGYTDMALGIALLLGYKLTDNFNSPYKATSVADFWRRWHITLSTWLLDYLFRPLQMRFRNMKNFGNALALFITFVVIGFWHGANWTFIVFGVIHGIYLAASVFTKKWRQKFYKKTNLTNNKIVKFLQILFTFHLIVFADIFFRADTVEGALDVISQIFTYFQPEVFPQFVTAYSAIMLLTAAGYVMHFIPELWKEKTRDFIVDSPLPLKAAFVAVVIWLAVQFRFADLQPFIYFQY